MTKQILVGGLPVGGGAPVSIQSMTNTPTQDVEATVAQIRRLAAAGCQIVRVAVPNLEAAKAVGKIKEQIDLPLVADIHFDYRLALECVAAGADKIRINPGNIGGADRVKAVAQACARRNIPIRIGVNGGSLEKPLLEKYGGVTPQEEVYAARDILKAIGLRREGPDLIACPTCGRTKIDLIPLAQAVEERLKTVTKPITVAVMGCPVNGPGEAAAADVGIAGGNGKGLLFRHGKVVKQVPQEAMVEELMALIETL